MNRPICEICEKPLEGDEFFLCTSCRIFFEWKYRKKGPFSIHDDSEVHQ